MSLNFKVIDRKDKHLCNFEEYPKVLSGDNTLADLMNHILSKSQYLSKYLFILDTFISQQRN